jgi:hypothetical protein
MPARVPVTAAPVTAVVGEPSTAKKDSATNPTGGTRAVPLHTWFPYQAAVAGLFLSFSLRFHDYFALDCTLPKTHQRTTSQLALFSSTSLATLATPKPLVFGRTAAVIAASPLEGIANAKMSAVVTTES